ncbi:hypothetical protein DV451_002263 [Geotrichum candidum]|uniref:Uncharacterized protein n=1 Tax=Geotrichum candidum TaxID=1173061 RepID=A0A9P5G669_GEOCN|nr:hypothetical protein DV451_002263 [Geotrichum candidum]KAF5108139.1 hypothetical protein DV453_002577 [Geotrichum candidum]
MGNAASKQARKLPVKPLAQAAAAAEQNAAAPLATRTKYEKFTPAAAPAGDAAAPQPADSSRPGDGMDPDTLYNDRLRELGQFNIPEQIQSQLHELQRQQQAQYQKSNILLSALASRASVEAETQRNLDDSNDGVATRRYLHPQTITAILTARDADGDSPEQIKAEFNLDDSVLARLGPWLRRPSAPPVLKPKTVVADVGREAREARRALSVDADMGGEDPR